MNDISKVSIGNISYNIKSKDTEEQLESLKEKIDNKWTKLTPRLKFVDMGLSVDWFEANIGATKPEEYGWYFMWGDTTAYNSDRTPVSGGNAVSFVWDNYKYCNGSANTLTKYCTKEANGTVDNKTVLEPEDDAAHIHLGGDCRMPTDAEFQELINACNTTWVENYNGSGINGRLFTLKSDSSKTLFFPASGELSYSALDWESSYGYCWTSSLYNSYSYKSNCFFLWSDSCRVEENNRYGGLPVRAVRPKQNGGGVI